MRASAAARVADIVARRHGLSTAVERLRSGANHVFRAGDAVIRVSPRAVAPIGWLGERGIPVPAALTPPEEIDGLHVSVWEHVPDTGRPLDFEQLGAVAARLHRLEPPAALPFCGD